MGHFSFDLRGDVEFFSCCAETIEYEAELRHKNEMLRVDAELKGK